MVLIGLLVYFIPITNRIDATYQGIQYRSNSNDNSENVSIYINGKYKYYFLKDDVFEGEIVIDLYTGVKNFDSIRFFNGEGLLTYSTSEPGTPDIDFFGKIFSKPFMNEFCIMVFEPIGEQSQGWSYENGLIICAPSSNLKDAKNIWKNTVNTNQ